MRDEHYSPFTGPPPSAPPRREAVTVFVMARLHEERVYVGDYYQAIHSVVVDAKEKRVSATIVDHCLRIIAVRAEVGGSVDAQRWGVSHMLHHLMNGAKCGLPDEQSRVAEIASINTVNEAMVNLLAHNLNDKSGHSLFLIGDREVIMELLFERVHVFVHLDFVRFFALAARSGVTLEWTTGPPTKRPRTLSLAFPGSPGAYGLRIIRDGATDAEYDEVLLYGFFQRIFGNFTPPRDLVKLLSQRKPRSKPPTDAGGAPKAAGAG